MPDPEDAAGFLVVYVIPQTDLMAVLMKPKQALW